MLSRGSFKKRNSLSKRGRLLRSKSRRRKGLLFVMLRLRKPLSNSLKFNRYLLKINKKPQFLQAASSLKYRV
jgi:hypothetical protein